MHRRYQSHPDTPPINNGEYIILTPDSSSLDAPEPPTAPDREIEFHSPVDRLPPLRAALHLTARQKVKLVFDLIRESSTPQEVADRLGIPTAEVERWLADFLHQSSMVLKISPTPEIRFRGRHRNSDPSGAA